MQADPVSFAIYAPRGTETDRAAFALKCHEKYVDAILTRVKEASARLNQLAEKNLDNASDSNKDMIENQSILRKLLRT